MNYISLKDIMDTNTIGTTTSSQLNITDCNYNPLWCTNTFTTNSYGVTTAIPEPPKPEVSENVKTIMKTDGKRIKIKCYNKGFYVNTKDIMPDIKNVSVYNDRAVMVEFVDGTKEKSVLDPQDEFSVEQGISICITKKLVGGSSIYNKLIDHAFNVMKKNKKAEEKAQVEENRRKEKAKKAAERNKKRKASKQEEQIKIIAEAIKKSK